MTLRLHSSQYNFCNCKAPEILIVDDEQINLDAIQALLKPYRLKIDTSTHPKDAIEKISQWVKRYKCSKCINYNVVVTDLSLPEMDGVEFAKRILAI